jgi:hypothetical protein
MIDYKKMLKELAPFMDKVVLCPALNEEIEILQSCYDKEIPDYFIEFLRVFGLKQDLTDEIFDRVDKYESFIDYMSSDIYFPIGSNLSEGYLFIKFDNQDQNIYEYYHDGNEIVNLGSFEEFIYKKTNQIKENYENIKLNTEKVFQAHYRIETGNDKFLIKELSKYIDVKLLKPLSHVDTNLIGTKKYEGLIQIDDYQLKLVKEGKHKIELQWEESVEEIIDNPFFLKLEAALDNCVFSYMTSVFWVARW